MPIITSISEFAWATGQFVSHWVVGSLSLHRPQTSLQVYWYHTRVVVSGGGRGELELAGGFTHAGDLQTVFLNTATLKWPSTPHWLSTQTRLRGTPRRAPDGFSRRAKCEPNNARQHHPTHILANHMPRARSTLDPTPRRLTTMMPRVRLPMPRSPGCQNATSYITCPPPAPARAYIYNTAASRTRAPPSLDASLLTSPPPAPQPVHWNRPGGSRQYRTGLTPPPASDVNIQHASLQSKGPPPNSAPAGASDIYSVHPGLNTAESVARRHPGQCTNPEPPPRALKPPGRPPVPSTSHAATIRF